MVGNSSNNETTSPSRPPERAPIWLPVLAVICSFCIAATKLLSKYDILLVDRHTQSTAVTQHDYHNYWSELDESLSSLYTDGDDSEDERDAQISKYSRLRQPQSKFQTAGNTEASLVDGTKSTEPQIKVREFETIQIMHSRCANNKKNDVKSKNISINNNQKTSKSTSKNEREALLAWTRDWSEDFRKRSSKMTITDFLDCAAFRFRAQDMVHSVWPSLLPLHMSPYSNNSSTTTKGEKKEKLPKAIIHIGPRKGGSTTIQAGLKQYKEALLNDANLLLLDYDLLSTLDGNDGGGINPRTKKKFKRVGHHIVAQCVFYYANSLSSKRTNCKEVIPRIRSEVEEAKQMGKNVIFSSETLDAVNKINATMIHDVFSGFEVHIVVVYRRFFEWIVSLWGEQYIGRGNYDQWSYNVTNVVSYLSRPIFLKYQLSTLSKIQFYQQAGFQVHILNLHSPGIHGDVSTSLLCSQLLESPKVCNTVLEDKEVIVAREGPSTTTYDEIAVAAKRGGLLDDAKNMTRSKARKQFQTHFEETLEWAESDFPKVCIQEQSLELLHRISEMVESLAVPEYYDEKGVIELSEHFEAYKRTKFCSIDTEKLLLSQGTALSSFNNHGTE